MFSYYEDEDEPVMETPLNDGKENIEETKKEVKEIQSQIDKLKFKLATIQGTCRHPEKEIKFVNVNGKQEVRWVCSVCDSVIGYPSPEEAKKFLF